MYAVIQIPVFPLQALVRQMRTRPKGPLAILDESGEQSHVICVNKIARHSEVSEGMRPAKALARCGNLQLLPRSETAEAEAEHILILLAQTLSPRIEKTDLGMATIDLRGTRKQGQSERCERLVKRFRSVGIFARIGIAGTPDHALWAAFFAKWVKEIRSVDAFLNHLPVAVTGIPEDIVEIFNGWGIRTLGEMKRLPREGIGARLGQRGLNLWDAVAGRRVRLLKLFETSPKFFRKLELNYRIEGIEALLFILKRFVDELAIELQVAHRAAYIFKLYLKLENKLVQKKRIEVPVPSSRASTLFRVLETALENIQTKGPVVGICLRLKTTEAKARQGDLFAVAMENVVGFTETADRIAALVGPGRSGSPRINNTWRPDSFRLEKLDTELDAEENDEAMDTPIGLPLERLRPPRSIRVFVEDGQPVAIKGGTMRGAVKQVKGPWRSSSDWWGRTPWTREEWDVEMEEGGLYRIFRNGKGWFVEGMYG